MVETVWTVGEGMVVVDAESVPTNTGERVWLVSLEVDGPGSYLIAPVLSVEASE